MKKPFRVSALLLLTAAFARPAAAQTQPAYPITLPTIGPGDSVLVNLQLQPDTLVAVPVEIDSVKLAWARRPLTLQEIVGDRISCFETDVPHTFNSTVMAHVVYFTQNNRRYMQRVLERENFYFPLFEKYLAKYNLPQDLKYLAVVESALIPTAKSRVGALGLWQFMGPTADDLRLRRDEWLDERMNPDKATEAACKHLRYLYGMFHDWELVLAAYNWGAGSVQRVMKRTGKRTFWELYPHMPQETRNYVPTFTAIMYSMKYAQQHQLHSPELRYQYAEQLDTLQLGGRAFDVSRFSRACGLDSAALFRFNPELRRHYLPANYRPYAVQFPATARPLLAEVDRETLFTYCLPTAALPQPLVPLPPHLEGVEPFPSAKLVAASSQAKRPADSAAAMATAAPVAVRRKVHTVRRGQTVAELATWYGVTPAQIRKWNKMTKGQELRSKQQVVVYVPQPAEPDAPAAATTVAARPAPTPAATTVPAVAAAPRPAAPTEAAAKPRRTPASDAVSSVETAKPATVAATETVASPGAEGVSAKAAAVAPAGKTAAKPATAAKAKEPVLAKAEPADTATAPVAAGGATEYVVRKGEYLMKIAREQGVSVAQLVAWNELSNEVVVPGQRLRLTPPNDFATPAPATAAAAAPAPKTAPKSAAKPVLNLPEQHVHIVEPGDTLYNISRRYQGLTVEQLRKLNHLKSDDVKPGQKLIVAS